MRELFLERGAHVMCVAPEQICASADPAHSSFQTGLFAYPAQVCFFQNTSNDIR
jgi:hypothetical protein